MPRQKKKLSTVLGDRVIYDSYIQHGQDAKQTSSALRVGDSTYPSRKQVGKAVKRMEEGRGGTGGATRSKKKINSGRLPILDDIGINKLKEEAEAEKRENRIIRLSIEEARKKVR